MTPTWKICPDFGKNLTNLSGDDFCEGVVAGPWGYWKRQSRTANTARAGHRSKGHCVHPSQTRKGG
jgi:hypothetical protein